jgi:hypothetical protein
MLQLERELLETITPYMELDLPTQWQQVLAITFSLSSHHVIQEPSSMLDTAESCPRISTTSCAKVDLPVNTVSSGHSPDRTDDSSAARVAVAVLEGELEHWQPILIKELTC